MHYFVIDYENESRRRRNETHPLQSCLRDRYVRVCVCVVVCKICKLFVCLISMTSGEMAFYILYVCVCLFVCMCLLLLQLCVCLQIHRCEFTPIIFFCTTKLHVYTMYIYTYINKYIYVCVPHRHPALLRYIIYLVRQRKILSRVRVFSRDFCLTQTYYCLILKYTHSHNII